MKNLLLIIDPQNDFTDHKGSLYVNGATEAISNICNFIYSKKPDDILISQDTHQKFGIGFPLFWDRQLKPFDKIKISDILEDKIKPAKIREGWEKDFKKQFKGKENGELAIWPYHCIEGSWGWCFPDSLVSALNDWGLYNPGHKQYEVYRKGYIPEIESYSILSDCRFSAEFPDLLDNDYDKIYVAGFCKDICVAESLKDLKQYKHFKGKIVFLENCMATLDPGSPNLKIYEELVSEFGAKTENA